LPERLNASYIGEDGQKHRPVMLHRAILGSFERFIGILIENYSGRLPAWLSPVQVALATINSNCNDYANEIASILRENEVRCITDFRNEKLNYKLRELSLQKINFIAIIGDREFKNKNVVLRTLGSKEQEVHSLDEFIKKIKNSCRID
jgi:threonyl-tRNA synthetase